MEKERIIELVKQGVLSMEEALELLEAAGQKETSKEFQAEVNKEDVDHFSKEYQEAMEDENVTAEDKQEQADLSAKVKELTDQLKKQEEALTIVSQRYRELEIFQEIDDLTPEMTKQLDDLTEQRVQLEQKIANTQLELDETQAELERINAEKFNQYSEDVKQFINDGAASAKRVGRTVADETKSLGQSLKSVVKDISNSFQMKDIHMGVKVPWLKSSVIEKTYEFDVHGLKSIAIGVLNGSVNVYAHEKDTIFMSLDIREFGNDGEISLETFEELNTIEYQNGAMIIDLKSPKYATDMEIYIPATVIENVTLNLFNGDLEAKNIDSQSLNIKNKNGDVDLENITAQALAIDTINSEIKVADSQIEESKIQNVNGDIRYQDTIHQLAVHSANSDIFITKTNEDASDIAVKSLSGNIKIALPEALSVQGEFKTSIGEVYSRLSNAEIVSKDNAHHIHRVGEVPATVKVSITNGDIFVKDTDQ
ncbi:DUF4097 family beta strand repeat protein [Aerococcaceae bacterium DSM 111176]|nr:DUF4097 family beta strand repeat protein [Aerococcaceae bacterium DSM 111176]